MVKTKYKFLKRLYPMCVIVFLKNNKYYVLYDDLYLLKCFKKKGLIKNLERVHIDYLILDDLVIVERKFFDDNRYQEYFYKGILIDIVKKGELIG